MRIFLDDSETLPRSEGWNITEAYTQDSWGETRYEMKTLTGSMAFLMVLLCGSAATMAEDKAGDRPGRAEMRERMIERFDEDGDGKLSEDERASAREAMQARRGRGGERAGRGRGPGEGPRRGPGPGLEGGRRGGPEARGAGRGRGPGGPDGPARMDPEKVFDRIDADGDGSISREEFMAHSKTMQERFAARGGRQGPQQRGDRAGRRGPGRDGEREFDGDRFRPNFNRDADGERPRGPRGNQDFRRGRGRDSGPGMGPPPRGRGPGFGPEGRRGPPEFRRGGPPGEDGPPRGERRRRGRRPDAESRDSADDSDDTASTTEGSALEDNVDASVEADTV